MPSTLLDWLNKAVEGKTFTLVSLPDPIRETDRTLRFQRQFDTIVISLARLDRFVPDPIKAILRTASDGSLVDVDEFKKSNTNDREMWLKLQYVPEHTELRLEFAYLG